MEEKEINEDQNYSLAEDHRATSKRSKQNLRKSVQNGLLKTVDMKTQNQEKRMIIL